MMLKLPPHGVSVVSVQRVARTVAVMGKEKQDNDGVVAEGEASLGGLEGTGAEGEAGDGRPPHGQRRSRSSTVN